MGCEEAAESEFHLPGDCAWARVGKKLRDAGQAHQLVGDVAGGDIGGEGSIVACAIDGILADSGEVSHASLHVPVGG